MAARLLPSRRWRAAPGFARACSTDGAGRIWRRSGDSNQRAFVFYSDVPTRGIYDNVKTAVDEVFVGKERVFNRRFLLMADHYMFEPTACTPATGWEKGQMSRTR